MYQILELERDCMSAWSVWWKATGATARPRVAGLPPPAIAQEDAVVEGRNAERSPTNQGGLSLHPDHSIEHPAGDGVAGTSREPSLAFRRTRGGLACGHRGFRAHRPVCSFSFEHARTALPTTGSRFGTIK